MIGKLNHVAIAVPNLAEAMERYRGALGASVSEPEDIEEHGVRIAFVELPNTKIELMEPLGEESPILKFLERSPAGGIHHVCYEVPDMGKAVEMLTAQGIVPLGGGEPKVGAHGKPVVFLRPKDMCGTLVELEEA